MKLNDLKTLILKSKNYNEKIHLSELYANLMIGNTELKYSDIDFENEMIASFEHICNDIDLTTTEFSSNICHIISTPYLEGGHTRLCEKLAKMNDSKDCLLITRDAKKNVLNRLENYFSEIYLADSINALDKIIEIIKYLARFKTIILHIHPDDILTIISIGLLKKINIHNKIFFVNHADHIFTFGRSVIDLMFLISYRGYEIEKTYSDSKYKLSFLGIPIDMYKQPRLQNSIKKILIAGSSYKMKPSSTISIQNEIYSYMSLHQKTNLIIIGAKITDYWWWKVKIKYWNRVSIYNSLPYSNYMNLLRQCDTCIDTAPSTGGTAFAEMYLNGLRPLAIYSGVYGYTPLDNIRGNTLQESKIKGDRLLNKIFFEIKFIHKKENVQFRYKDALKLNCHDIPESLTKLNNDLHLYLNSRRKSVPLSILKKLITLKTISFTDKFNLFIFNIDLFDLLNKNTIKLIRLVKVNLTNLTK